MIYAAAKKSCIAYVNQLIKRCPSPVAYLEWSAASDVDSIPAGDVAGLQFFTFTDNGNSWSGSMSVNVSTHQDVSGLRLTDLVDVFFEGLRTDNTFPCYDPVSATIVGTFFIPIGTMAAPVMTAMKRPIQMITAPLRLSLPSD